MTFEVAPLCGCLPDWMALQRSRHACEESQLSQLAAPPSARQLPSGGTQQMPSLPPLHCPVASMKQTASGTGHANCVDPPHVANVAMHWPLVLDATPSRLRKQ